MSVQSLIVVRVPTVVRFCRYSPLFAGKVPVNREKSDIIIHTGENGDIIIHTGDNGDIMIHTRENGDMIIHTGENGDITIHTGEKW